MGKRLGLDICAGHGLDYVNTRAIAGGEEIAELNIGHSLIARAMIVGMERAVSDMLALMRSIPSELSSYCSAVEIITLRTTYF